MQSVFHAPQKDLRENNALSVLDETEVCCDFFIKALSHVIELLLLILELNNIFLMDGRTNLEENTRLH